MINILKKIDRWLWLVTHRKEPKKYDVYNRINLSGFICGLFICMGMLALIVGLSEIDVYGCVIGGLGILWGFIIYYILRKSVEKDGYVDMLHKHEIDEWHKQRKKYGVE